MPALSSYIFGRVRLGRGVSPTPLGKGALGGGALLVPFRPRATLRSIRIGPRLLCSTPQLYHPYIDCNIHARSAFSLRSPFVHPRRIVHVALLGKLDLSALLPTCSVLFLVFIWLDPLGSSNFSSSARGHEVPLQLQLPQGVSKGCVPFEACSEFLKE